MMAIFSGLYPPLLTKMVVSAAQGFRTSHGQAESDFSVAASVQFSQYNASSSFAWYFYPIAQDERIFGGERGYLASLQTSAAGETSPVDVPVL